MIDSELNRIAAVKALGILDTEPEQVFDDAVKLAAAICGTPISAITFLDERRQWFKASVGLEVHETPKEYSFCAHTVRSDEMFVVSDASVDPRFQHNPLVTGDPNVRFYAGMPLTDKHGYTLGTLCVIDTKSRELTPEQKKALTLLSQQVSTQLRLRSQVEGLSEALVENTLLQKKIGDSNALFEAFMDNSPMVGFMKDEAGHLIYYNRMFAERFHIAPTEWLNKTDFDIWPEFAERYRATDLAVLQGDVSTVVEEVSPGPSGANIHWRTYKFPFVDARGNRFLAGMSLDISIEKEAENSLRRSHEELHKANARLREMSITDALTGIGNRRCFDERLQREFNLARRYGTDFSLMMLDVDHFKPFNDTFGHEAGDEVLRSLGNLLLQCSRLADVVCRYGGEEFALLLPNTSLGAAVLLGDRIRTIVESSEWRCREITISLGVATTEADMKDVPVLVRRADMALYEAKALGRNRVVPYSSALESAGRLRA